MKVAIDVFYQEDAAKIVAAVFDNWLDKLPDKIIVKYKKPIAPYIPGEFYQRELPCLIDIISDLDLSTIDVIIIDGYVYLDNNGKQGLGAHLYDKLNKQIPVIGVAKTSFYLNTTNVRKVYRGRSKQPLYLTSIGTELDQAAYDISSMYGEYRMPHILKLIDTETKK